MIPESFYNVNAQIYKCYLNFDNSRSQYCLSLKIGNKSSLETNKKYPLNMALIQFNQQIQLKVTKSELQNAHKCQIIIFKYTPISPQQSAQDTVKQSSQRYKKQIFALASIHINDLNKRQRRKQRLTNNHDKCALIQLKIFIQDTNAKHQTDYRKQWKNQNQNWIHKIQLQIPETDQVKVQHKVFENQLQNQTLLSEHLSHKSGTKTCPQMSISDNKRQKVQQSHRFSRKKDNSQAGRSYKQHHRKSSQKFNLFSNIDFISYPTQQFKVFNVPKKDKQLRFNKTHQSSTSSYKYNQLTKYQQYNAKYESQMKQYTKKKSKPQNVIDQKLQKYVDAEIKDNQSVSLQLKRKIKKLSSDKCLNIIINRPKNKTNKIVPAVVQFSIKNDFREKTIMVQRDSNTQIKYSLNSYMQTQSLDRILVQRQTNTLCKNYINTMMQTDRKDLKDQGIWFDDLIKLNHKQAQTQKTSQVQKYIQTLDLKQSKRVFEEIQFQNKLDQFQHLNQLIGSQESFKISHILKSQQHQYQNNDKKQSKTMEQAGIQTQPALKSFGSDEKKQVSQFGIQTQFQILNNFKSQNKRVSEQISQIKGNQIHQEMNSEVKFQVQDLDDTVELNKQYKSILNQFRNQKQINLEIQSSINYLNHDKQDDYEPIQSPTFQINLNKKSNQPTSFPLKFTNQNVPTLTGSINSKKNRLQIQVNNIQPPHQNKKYVENNNKLVVKQQDSIQNPSFSNDINNNKIINQPNNLKPLNNQKQIEQSTQKNLIQQINRSLKQIKNSTTAQLDFYFSFNSKSYKYTCNNDTIKQQNIISCFKNESITESVQFIEQKDKKMLPFQYKSGSNKFNTQNNLQQKTFKIYQQKKQQNQGSNSSLQCLAETSKFNFNIKNQKQQKLKLQQVYGLKYRNLNHVNHANHVNRFSQPRIPISSIKSQQKPFRKYQKVGFKKALQKQNLSSQISLNINKNKTIGQIDDQSSFQITSRMKNYNENNLSIQHAQNKDNKDPKKVQNRRQKQQFSQINIIQPQKKLKSLHFQFENNTNSQLEESIQYDESFQLQKPSQSQFSSDTDSQSEARYSNRADINQQIKNKKIKNCFDLYKASKYLRLTNDTMSSTVQSLQSQINLINDQNSKNKVEKTLYQNLLSLNKQTSEQLQKIRAQKELIQNKRSSLERLNQLYQKMITKLQRQNSIIKKNYKQLKQQFVQMEYQEHQKQHQRKSPILRNTSHTNHQLQGVDIKWSGHSKQSYNKKNSTSFKQSNKKLIKKTPSQFGYQANQKGQYQMGMKPQRRPSIDSKMSQIFPTQKNINDTPNISKSNISENKMLKNVFLGKQKNKNNISQTLSNKSLIRTPSIITKMRQNSNTSSFINSNIYQGHSFQIQDVMANQKILL